MQQDKAPGRILARHVGGLQHHPVLSSPQPRALHTARIALGALGAVASPDSRLREISIGQLEGLRREEIPGHGIIDEGDSFWWRDHAPDGEGHLDVAARVAALLADIASPAILVTHGITACHLRGQLMGLSRAESALHSGK